MDAVGDTPFGRGGGRRDKLAVRGGRCAIPLFQEGGAGRHRLHGRRGGATCFAASASSTSSSCATRTTSSTTAPRSTGARSAHSAHRIPLPHARHGRSLWRSISGTGSGRCRSSASIRGQAQLRQLVPPVFAASLVLTMVLAPFAGLDRLLFETELGVYASANVTASVWSVRKRAVGEACRSFRRRSRSSTWATARGSSPAQPGRCKTRRLGGFGGTGLRRLGAAGRSRRRTRSSAHM